MIIYNINSKKTFLKLHTCIDHIFLIKNNGLFKFKITQSDILDITIKK